MQIKPCRRDAELTAEQAFELARGNLRIAGDVGFGHRLLHGFLHLLECGEELLVTDTVAMGKLHALRLLRRAKLPVHKLLCDAARQLAAVLRLDNVQHEVHSGNTAAAGDDRAVNHVEIVAYR